MNCHGICKKNDIDNFCVIPLPNKTSHNLVSMLHFSINAHIYYGESLELSDHIQVSFLGANWSCQCKHVCQKML